MGFEVNKNKIIKNTTAMYIRMGVTMLISFYTARVTLQVLGVDDYGLNNLVGGVVSLFSFLNASMGTAVQRFLSIQIGKGDNERLRNTFGVGLYLHIIIAVVTLVLLEVFAIFFLSKLNIPQERHYAAQIVFQLSSVSLVFNILSVPYAALLRAREEFANMAYIEIIQALLRLLNLYFLCTIAFDKLILLSSLNFLVSLLYVLALVILARHKYIEATAKTSKDLQLIKEMFSFISVLLVTVLASLFRDKGVIILVNLFFGLAVNAAYAVAMQVMSLVNTFALNFKQSIVPQMMAAYGANDTSTMIKLINTGTKITFLLMALLTVPLIFEVDYILRLWLQNPPEYSSQLVILILVNINIASFAYFLVQGIHATGKILWQQVCVSALYIITIILMWIAFKMGANLYYALYIMIGSSILQCIIDCYFAHKNYDYPSLLFIHIIVKSTIVLLITCVCIYILTRMFEPSFVRLCLTLLLSTSLVCVLGYYVLLDNVEKEKVKSMKNVVIHRLYNR